MFAVVAPERDAAASENVGIHKMNCVIHSFVRPSGDPGMLPHNTMQSLESGDGGNARQHYPRGKGVECKLGGTSCPQHRVWVGYNSKR